MSHEVETMAYAHESKVIKKAPKKAAKKAKKIDAETGKEIEVSVPEVVATDATDVTAYETPWHGLGVPVTNELSPQQMLKKAGLDWKVELVPQTIELDGQTVKTGMAALVRSTQPKGTTEPGARILSSTSETWNPLQNDETFEFFNEVVMDGKMEMNTAGSLFNGKRVWALAKVIDQEFSLFKGKDRVETFLLFSSPHEYGKSIDIRFTPIRVVCNNTLTYALSQVDGAYFKQSHRKKFDAELAKKTLKIASEKLDEYKKAAEFLSKKRFTPDQVNEFYQKAFPLNNTWYVKHKAKLGKTVAETDPNKLSRPAELAKGVLDTQPGADLGEGTFWALFNSVTFAIDHKLGRSQDNRLESSWFGSNGEKKKQALKIALEMAKAS